MKLTFIMRDSVTLIVNSIAAEEAHSIVNNVASALSANPMGTASISYPDGTMYLLPVHHLQAVKLEP